MNYKVIEELENPANNRILLGLDRIKEILLLLGNPQNSYKVVHITGTNGKGSTAAFIECGLIHAGYKVGKYTSPHINKINENISLNGNVIADDDLERLFFQVKAVQNQHNIELSPFELLTVIMFCYFKEQLIDYLVLEVGMGGANDATNVIDEPLCVVITNISLEHTNWFGSSLMDIANEKSGIIKSDIPVIIADSSHELQLAICNKSPNITNVLEKYDAIIELDFDNFRTNLTFNERIEVQKLVYEKNDISDSAIVSQASKRKFSYQLSLFGKFQAYNFLCAYEVFNFLGISESAIKYAAQNTLNGGRLQLISKNPNVLIDATHNEAGAKVLYESLTEHYHCQDIVIVTSILADKNIKSMLTYFGKIANCIICTSINNTSRGMSAQDLYEKALEYSLNKVTKIYTIDNPIEALEFAKKLSKKHILITGSLYLLKYYTENGAVENWRNHKRY
ncbi:MAG: bifunctional folylpolyglutamate synthase/dihydrofolate synthase [Neisseriaceae bacterium]